MSNLVAHAREELDRAGMFDPDADYGGALGEAVMTLVETFAAQQHSGMSAAVAIDLFARLARFEPLTPITSDPEEWNEVTREFGEKHWQNRRRSTTFSRDGGRTWYDIEDASKNNGDTWVTDEQTRAYLREVGIPEDTAIVLDAPTKSRIWDELYELQRSWREEQGLPHDGSVMFDAELNTRLRATQGDLS